jgi:GH24 family phage-related lysozyme (muramidase)
MGAIGVTFSQATAEFVIEVQKYTTLTQNQLPNFAALSSDCRGALVSLVYNRGPSFDVPKESDASGRYKEMRSIREHMIQKTYDLIPDEIRGMVRLWPDTPGLIKRRQAEATLFQQGLG